MSIRREIAQQLRQMQSEIRRGAQNGTFASREMLPSVRELAREYGISHNLASQGLKALVEEGVIYSVPRVGNFVGSPLAGEIGSFLLLIDRPHLNPICHTVQIGFEEGIARLGGSCLTLERETAREWSETGQLPPIAGVFEFDEVQQTHELWGRSEIDAPHVRFGELGENGEDGQADLVYFDNVGGGRTATQHLLDLGHREIAFLGLHGPDDDPHGFLWSKEREDGWRAARQSAGLSGEGPVFQPPKTPPIHIVDQLSATREVAQRMVQKPLPPALVIVNRYAAQSFFEVLREAKIAGEKWPTIVCFDTQAIAGRDKAAHVTALRLPWEEIGRAGAELLCARARNQAPDTPQQTLVTMRLIRRLSCRREWIGEASKITRVSSAARISTASVQGTP